jgi:tuftelin-interacting protein 11
VHGSFAGFEAHTLGIGSRLMAGWGWREGEGLGRARQGRPEPLLAVLRERQLGLGAE